MKRLATLSLMAVALLFLAGPAKAKSITGQWAAVKMKRGSKERPLPKELQVHLDFLRGGEFVGTIITPQKRESKKGTWETKGKWLHTSVDGKAEKMMITHEGDFLVLIKPKKKEKLYLKKR
jgi:hypothetical protein